MERKVHIGHSQDGEETRELTPNEILRIRQARRILTAAEQLGYITNVIQAGAREFTFEEN